MNMEAHLFRQDVKCSFLYFMLSKASETTQTLYKQLLFKIVTFTVCEIFTVFRIRRNKIFSQSICFEMGHLMSEYFLIIIK